SRRKPGPTVQAHRRWPGGSRLSPGLRLGVCKGDEQAADLPDFISSQTLRSPRAGVSNDAGLRPDESKTLRPLYLAASSSALTPGSSRPSSHSRKAPPAVET